MLTRIIGILNTIQFLMDNIELFDVSFRTNEIVNMIVWEMNQYEYNMILFVNNKLLLLIQYFKICLTIYHSTYKI